MITRSFPLLLLVLGCSHAQAYRGAFAGKVVDPTGHPVPGATVVVCTADGSSASFAGCPHRAEAWTDPEGRFQFSPVKVKEWGFGESPLPPTHLTACARDSMGRALVAASVVVDASGATEPRVAVTPPEGSSPSDACLAPR
jgi:hypothetical protein